MRGLPGRDAFVPFFSDVALAGRWFAYGRLEWEAGSRRPGSRGFLSRQLPLDRVLAVAQTLHSPVARPTERSGLLEAPADQRPLVQGSEPPTSRNANRRRLPSTSEPLL